MTSTKNELLNNFKNLISTYTSRADGNLAFHVGDNPLDVTKHHQKLATKLGYNPKTLVHMKQIHSNIVHKIDADDNFQNPPTCDALITNKEATPLMVMVADCSPILFYDKNKKVIAVAHAGRAGAFTNIIKNVIDTFTSAYNSNPKDIVVSIGPSIGKCCYEVGREIYDEAKKLNLEFALEKKAESYFLDIGAILYKQLLDSKIQKHHIELSRECNCCKSEIYFSYRKSSNTGRFCGIIMLQEISSRDKTDKNNSLE